QSYILTILYSTPIHHHDLHSFPTRRSSDLHLKLNAQEENGIMVVLQAIDAAGKDEAISYIFSNLNAQGLKVTSFGKPTEEDKKQDYLRRIHAGEPNRGEVAILNR